MLEEAHRGLEVMSAACNAIKDEEWKAAQRCLTEIQQITERLLREIGENNRRAMMSKCDPRDRAWSHDGIALRN